MKAVDTNKLPDLMPRVARMLTVGGMTMQDVVQDLRTTDLTEYSIFLTIKGAAMCYPHVKEALDEYMEVMADTQRPPIQNP